MMKPEFAKPKAAATQALKTWSVPAIGRRNHGIANGI